MVANQVNLNQMRASGYIRNYTKPQREGSCFSREVIGREELLVIPSQSQVILRKATLDIKGVSSVFERIVVDDPRGNSKHIQDVIKLTAQDIRILTSENNNEELSRWALKHGYTVTKVNYVTGKVLRFGNQYEQFMCDIPPETRLKIERNLEKETAFDQEECELYCRNTWWEAIDLACKDDPEAYNKLALRALKTFKGGSLDVHDVCKILIYTRAKIEIPHLKIDSFKALRRRDSFVSSIRELEIHRKEHYGPFGRVNANDMVDMQAFIGGLPKEDRICFSLPALETKDYLGDATFTERACFPNFLMHYFSGIDELSVLPVFTAGIAHFSRFTSSLGRIVSLPIPGLACPHNIHDQPAFNWLSCTGHDVQHLMIEANNFNRDAWIICALDIYAQFQDQALYELMLDRSFLGVSFKSSVEGIFDIAKKTKVKFQASKQAIKKALFAWYKKRHNSRLFNTKRIFRSEATVFRQMSCIKA